MTHPGEIDVSTAVLRLFTVKQTGELLGYSERQVRRMIAAGKIRTVRDGGSVRVLPESIIAYKQQLREAAGEPVCPTCSGEPQPGFICGSCGRSASVAS
jgi:excisionase family DNA binding protein